MVAHRGVVQALLRAPRAQARAMTISRRSVLGAALAGAALAAVPAIAAQPAPREKGPRVWLDLDQKELDDAYDQAVYAPNADQLHKRRIANSEAARARLGQPKRMAYGPTAIEMLDIYQTRRANAPIQI